MSNQNLLKTPRRALTLAELDLSYVPNQETEPRPSKLTVSRPLPQPLRMVDLMKELEELSTAGQKTGKNNNKEYSSARKYNVEPRQTRQNFTMSTSKKPARPKMENLTALSKHSKTLFKSNKMSNQNLLKTPRRALTLAELDLSYVPNQETEPSPSKPTVSRPLPQPLRMVDLMKELEELSTAGQKTGKNNNKGYSSARKYNVEPRQTRQNFTMSTSKKPARPKMENLTALSKHSKTLFKSNKIESPNVLKKYKQEIRKTCFPLQTVLEDPNSDKSEKSYLPRINEVRRSNRVTSIGLSSSSWRSKKTPQKDKSEPAKPTQSFMQYRTADKSFDTSCEESPMSNKMDKSLSELSESNNIQENLSDSLCEIFGRAHLTSSRVTILRTLKANDALLQENIKNMEKMSAIFSDLLKNERAIAEGNKTLMSYFNDEIKSTKKNHSKVKNTTKSPAKEASKASTSKSILKETPKSPKILNSERSNKRYDLRTSVLLAEFKNKYDPVKRKSPSCKNKLSFEDNDAQFVKPSNTLNEIKFNVPSIKKSMSPSRKCVTISSSSKKRRMSPMRNDENSPPAQNDISTVAIYDPYQKSALLTTPQSKKSLSIYTTLKKNMHFLKTPTGQGKSKAFSNIGNMETPNTRSRSITSSNIQKQLARLYDD